MAPSRVWIAILLLLFVAGCAGGRTPSSAGYAPNPQTCEPRAFDYQNAYSNQDTRAGRVYYANLTLSDCTKAYGLGFEGEINERSVDRLIRAYRQDSKQNEVRFLVLNSSGGSVLAGLTLAQFIIAEDLAAVVGDDMICVSMCSFVFITANKRIMSERSKLGIHSASDFRGRANYETNYTLASLLALVPGAHADAYLSIANGTPPDEVTWLSAEQARSLGFAD